MMKYLPGNKKVQAAKEDIVKDWKIDFQKSCMFMYLIIMS